MSKKEKTNPTTTSAQAVAQYLLNLDPQRKYFNKSSGNFRLNTLLHLCQILYCAKYKKPLFKDPLFAYPPQWHKLSQPRQKRLSEIIHDPAIKHKKSLILRLYQEQKVNLTPSERDLIKGVK